MEAKELETLKTDIVSGVSAVVQKKYDSQVADLHTELKQTNDAIQKMRMGAFGRVDAQDKAEMDHAVCNYFMHDILRLDGVTKDWDSETSGAASEMIPSELGSRFIEKLNTYNKLRQNCTIYPSDKGTLFVENAAATNVTVAATRPPAATESAPTFSAVTYSTRGRQAWLAVDEKVVRQSPLQVLDIVLTQLAKGLTAGEYADFITGDGTTDWSGLDTAAISSTAAPHDLQTIATLTASETVAPYWALTSPYRQGPSINKTMWICSASYAAQLATLNAAGKEWFKFGTGVNTYMGVPIWEHASVTSSGHAEPCVYVGDLSQYYIFDALGTMLRTATGGKTLTVGHQILVEAYNETDGKLPLTEAFKSLTLHVD